METLIVKLAGREYPIVVGDGAFNKALETFRELAKSGSSVFCIADKVVLKKHTEKAEALKEVAKIIEVDGGEKTKSIRKFGQLCSQLAELKADRKSAVVALGGGVVGDLTGFVAASYMRGVDFYQIPTTLLAMVDSSVGGKTGVNIPEGKNLVGAFHQPKGVFTDISFLKTLPSRQFAAGMAEVIKCAVLGDVEFFGRLASMKKKMKFNSPELIDAIISSCSLKADVVAADELETASSGGRALLNLGHTFGHAIEHNAGYGKYLHGEAVAIGMVMASVLSRGLGLCGDSEISDIVKLLKFANLPVSLKNKMSADEFIDAMSRDKKATSGGLRFVLIESIGKSLTQKVDEDVVRRAIDDFYKM